MKSSNSEELPPQSLEGGLSSVAVVVVGDVVEEEEEDPSRIHVGKVGSGASRVIGDEVN